MGVVSSSRPRVRPPRRRLRPICVPVASSGAGPASRCSLPLIWRPHCGGAPTVAADSALIQAVAAGERSADPFLPDGCTSKTIA